MRDGVYRGACNQRYAVAEVASHAAQQERAEECFFDERDRDRREKIFRYQRSGRFVIADSTAADSEREPEQDRNRDHRNGKAANRACDTWCCGMSEAAAH